MSELCQSEKLSSYSRFLQDKIRDCVDPSFLNENSSFYIKKIKDCVDFGKNNFFHEKNPFDDTLNIISQYSIANALHFSNKSKVNLSS